MNVFFFKCSFCCLVLLWVWIAYTSISLTNQLQFLEPGSMDQKSPTYSAGQILYAVITVLIFFFFFLLTCFGARNDVFTFFSLLFEMPTSLTIEQSSSLQFLLSSVSF